MHKVIRQDLPFVGNREYVNSTSLFMLFIDAALAADVELAGPSTLLDGHFHSPVRANGELYLTEDSQPPVPMNSVAASMRLLNDSKSLYGYFVPNVDLPVTQRVEADRSVTGLALTGAWAGRCSIRFDDVRTLLENGIEANKQLHLAMPGHAHSTILNLFMRRVPLGLTPPPSGRTEIVIENLGSRTRPDGVVTLNRVTFPEFSGQSYEISYLAQHAT